MVTNSTGVVSVSMEIMNYGCLVTAAFSQTRHNTFEIPYGYDSVTELCRQQAQDIQNHENSYIRNIGQGEAQQRKYKRIKLGGGQAYDH
jgi:hypothetical protein